MIINKKYKTLCILTSYCGGADKTSGVSNYLINQLKAINAINLQNEVKITPYVITPYYARNIITEDGNKLFRKDVYHNNTLICQRWNGKLILALNTSRRPYTRLWDNNMQIEQEDSISKVVLKILVKEAHKYDIIRIIAHDIHSLMIHKIINQITLNKNNLILPETKFMWVPHSTSLSYAEGGLNKSFLANTSTYRYQREVAAIKYAQLDNYYVGAISEYFAKHLQQDYALPASQLKLLKSGIIFDDYYNKITSIETELTNRGIPLECKYIYSVGAGILHKGHDIALKAFAEVITLRDMPQNLHLVILAPNRSNQDTEHTARLKTLISKFNISSKVSLIEQWDDNLSNIMWSLPQTLATILPVRSSPDDLIPMEARVNPVRSIVISSNRGSKLQQIQDGVTGFLADIDGNDCESLEQIKTINPNNLYLKNKNIVTVLRKLITLDPVAALQIVKNGKLHTMNQNNAVKNITNNLLLD